MILQIFHSDGESVDLEKFPNAANMGRIYC